MRPVFTTAVPALELWPGGHVVGTERLVIRTITEVDALPVQEAIRESLASLGRWLPWAQPDRSFDHTLRWCREAEGRFALRLDCHLLIWTRDGVLVGGLGLHPRDPRVPAFEIGYWCRGTQTGKGYITEAVRGIAAVAYRALGIRRLEIRCDPENILSIAVARRARFVQEATLRQGSVTVDGHPRDEQVWALLATDDAATKLPNVQFCPGTGGPDPG
jgi:RimJ/RimL family protein N-acetyltransferase